MPTDSGTVQVYIVRHGATRLNNQASISVDRERGWSDVPLTEEGRQEARAAAAKLKSKGIGAIVSSDLNRAKETARIIGGILGIKPEFSFKLRPWNLGYLTEKVMKEVKPKIAAYAHYPDEPVPKGETFNTFKDRAFEGLDEAVRKHGHKTLVIVCHHRVERLVAAWEKAGQGPDHQIDLGTFLEKGDPPGGIITLRTTEAALSGGDRTQSKLGIRAQNQSDTAVTKLTHEQAHFGNGSGNDRCGTCKAYLSKNNCKKVVPPIDTDDWCAVGVSKLDGHRFDPRGEKIEEEHGMAGNKPSINAGMDELRGQMARGSQHGASPGSAGNIGGKMGMAKPAAGGATAGVGANPSRVGAPAPVSGSYKPIAGSPGPSAPPTADSVRTHSLAIGGMKHMVAAGHLQPAHAKQMEAKSRAHIAAYKGAKGQAKPAASAPRRFGSLGGMGGVPQGPSGIAPGSGGDGIPGASPIKMDY